MLAPLLAFALMALQQPSAEHSVQEPEDTPVVLRGTIRFLHGFGPPGWGEDPKHDAHITYWVIDLPAPINTPCTPERPELAAAECASAKQLRIIVEGEPRLLAEAKAALGRKAAVTGVLHRQDTAGEMTPIFMDPTAIQPLPPERAR